MKPMLGYNKPFDLDALSYPVYASPKLDGIRCLVKDGVGLSRKLLPIPNKFVQSYFAAHPELSGLDGELIVGDWTAEDVYRKTMSGVMSIEGEPEFHFVVFDAWDRPDEPFMERLPQVDQPDFRTVVLSQALLHSADEVRKFESLCLHQGYEGAILRDPDSKYKFGRSTLKEAALLKLKTFQDFDVRITAIHEAIRNDNEATTDELGHTKRSHSKAGRTEGKGYVGSMEGVVLDEEFKDVPAGIGTFKGLTIADKEHIWQNRDEYAGRVAKVKAMPYGMKDALRHGVFIGWRDERD